jgi:hypothetical protein
MHRSSLVLAAVAAVLLVPGAALAHRFQSFDGRNLGGPTFNRPNPGTGAAVPSGQVVNYQAQTIRLVSPTTCDFYSAQDYDGFLSLYQGAAAPGFPAGAHLASNDDANLGVGTSELRSQVLAAGTYTLVNSAFVAGQVGSFQTTIHCVGAVQPLHGSCPSYVFGIPVDRQVCLHDRFAVAVEWATQSTSGVAGPVRAGSRDSAFFTFFNPSNYELVVKVLNACAPPFNAWWVFLGGLTNQQYLVRVLDTQSGIENQYFNPLGQTAQTVTDTSAFGCP